MDTEHVKAMRKPFNWYVSELLNGVLRAIPLTFVFGMLLASASAADSAPARGFFARFRKPAFNELSAMCAQPADVCRLADRFISDRREARDTWTTAEDTWTRGRGDCEDFSVLIESLCSELNFDAHVRLYYPTTPGLEGHAVVTGQWNGKFWVSSMGSYREFSTDAEAKASVAREMGYKPSHLWSVDLKKTDVARFINREKTSPAPVGSVSASVHGD